jgi:hypothetical protein
MAIPPHLLTPHTGYLSALTADVVFLLLFAGVWISVRRRNKRRRNGRLADDLSRSRTSGPEDD